MDDQEETCIVCLGGLGVSNGVYAAPTVKAADISDVSTTNLELIAHLLPCGHYLHDECLKPWVERANSCPICRQNFNEVQLTRSIGGNLFPSRESWRYLIDLGSVTNSYKVSDKAQVAEDPDISEIVDDGDPDYSQSCILCGNGEDAEVLLLCDGCGDAYHTYCVSLHDVPSGPWLCEECQVQEALELSAEEQLRGDHQQTDVQIRSRRSRLRGRNHGRASGWARVWQSVWDQLNLDLDVPSEDEGERHTISSARAVSYGRNQYATAFCGNREWQRRLEVAQRQGASSRFRETAPALLGRRQAAELPKETAEERLAWNTFEMAKKKLEAEPQCTRSHKPKSAASSPSEGGSSRRKRRRSASPPHDMIEQPSADRPFKRPQTRRIPGPQTRLRYTSDIQIHKPTSGEQAPSFLQSLLREVESSCPDDISPPVTNTTPSHVLCSGQLSPSSSSPGNSPRLSYHSPSRATSLTPPPLPSMNSGRPGSPVLLSSSIEPMYVASRLAPQGSGPLTAHPAHSSTARTIELPGSTANTRNKSEDTETNLRPKQKDIVGSPELHSSLPLSAKETLSKLVKGALRAPWKEGLLSKDQYTDVNRCVCHKLYGICESYDVDQLESDIEAWRKRAEEEVLQTVETLTKSTQRDFVDLRP